MDGSPGAILSVLLTKRLELPAPFTDKHVKVI